MVRVQLFVGSAVDRQSLKDVLFGVVLIVVGDDHKGLERVDCLAATEDVHTQFDVDSILTDVHHACIHLKLGGGGGVGRGGGGGGRDG